MAEERTESKIKEEKKQLRQLERALPHEHLSAIPGLALGQRRPDNDDEGGSGGNGFQPGFQPHPMLANMPEGAADPALSSNIQDNADVKHEAQQRSNELSPQAQPSMQNQNQAKPGASLPKPNPLGS